MEAPLFSVPSRLRPKFDLWVPLIVLCLSAAGIFTLWGAAATGAEPARFVGYPRVQLRWVVLGVAAMSALIAFDYRWARWVVWPLYALLVVVLVYLLLFGRSVHGASSWIFIGVGSRRFQYQPSEIGKVIVVVALARYLSVRVTRFRKFHHTLVPLAIVGLPMGLIALQPDLGTALVFLPAAFAMFFVAGMRKRVLLTYALLAALAAVAAYPNLRDYQKQRIQSFLRQGEDASGRDYNIIQAQAALGSGGLFGKGWGHGTQTSFRFLPEFHSDFVFPTVGEQFGLFGCIVVLILYGVLIARLAWLASRSDDLFGALLVAGLTAVLAIHIVFNIGMATGLLPVTGLPLPFFSYGGSFMLTCYIMIGLALSVGARSRPRPLESFEA